MKLWFNKYNQPFRELFFAIADTNLKIQISPGMTIRKLS